MRTFLKIALGTFGAMVLALFGLAAWASQQHGEGVQAAPTAPAPPFKFRNLKSGMSLAEAKAAKAVKECDEFKGETTCELTDNDPMTVSGSTYHF